MKALSKYFLLLCLLIGNTIPLTSLAGNGSDTHIHRVQTPSEIAIHPATPAHGYASQHLKFVALEEIEEDFETDHQNDLKLGFNDVRMLLSILMLNPLADQQIHKLSADDHHPRGPVQRRHLVLCTFLI